ncbi:MAG: cyclase, partial [Candidatus Melainabacteria bacterium]
YGIENLNNLDQLPAKGILLFCGVPALEGGTGCPARVVAIVDRPN